MDLLVTALAAIIIKSSTLDILQDSEYAFAEAQSKFLSSYLNQKHEHFQPKLILEQKFRTNMANSFDFSKFCNCYFKFVTKKMQR